MVCSDDWVPQHALNRFWFCYVSVSERFSNQAVVCMFQHDSYNRSWHQQNLDSPRERCVQFDLLRINGMIVFLPISVVILLYAEDFISLFHWVSLLEFFDW